MNFEQIEGSLKNVRLNDNPEKLFGVFNKSKLPKQSNSQNNAQDHLIQNDENRFNTNIKANNEEESSRPNNLNNEESTNEYPMKEHESQREPKTNVYSNENLRTRTANLNLNEFGDHSDGQSSNRRFSLSQVQTNAHSSNSHYAEDAQFRYGSSFKSKSKRYIPVKKLEKELFDPENNIEAGPYFDETYSDLAIEITGGDGSKVLLDKFEDCKFAPPIMKNIELKKYAKPMPIQQAAIPVILSKLNFDMMGHAQTGSGKSAAYFLPIIDSIYRFKLQKSDGLNTDAPYVLVIAPTRELANQLHEDATAYANGTSVKVVVAYGEYNVNANIREIRKGCDVLCATTGRLLHFLESGVIKLDRLKFLILDEADKLLMDKFYDDIVMLSNSKSMNQTKRTFMFSATFNVEIQQMARQFLKPSYFFINIGILNSAAKNVAQEFIQINYYDKQKLLRKILHHNSETKTNSNGEIIRIVPKTIIFVEHKRISDRIAVMLSLDKIKSMSINGDRNQKQRQEALNNFVKGDIHVLVSTNVAARGLNIRGVKHVINYDLPKDRENYIHRIGRTGRVGHQGKATSFFDPGSIDDCQLAPEFVEILNCVQQEVPKFLIEIADSFRNANPHSIINSQILYADMIEN